MIATGTLPGVGLGMKPPRFLTEGDVVEASIEGLGRQQKGGCVNFGSLYAIAHIAEHLPMRGPT